MATDKEIFLNWIKDKTIPDSELDLQVADKNNLKFNNHSENADSRVFIRDEKLESAFKLLQHFSY